MLEFLKDYNKFKIYERARYAEFNIKSFDALTPMASLVEALFKSAYAEYYCIEDNYQLKNITIFEMLGDNRLKNYVRQKYGISNDVLDIINNKIRKSSNFNRHDVDPFATTKAVRRDCFRAIYLLSAGYYKMHSGNDAPEWNEEAFEKLYAAAVDENTKKKLEKETAPEIEKLQKQIESAKKEKTEANERIEQLTEELKAARLNNADKKELSELNSKVNELESEIDKAKGQSVILKEMARSAIAEKNKAEEDLSALTRYYKETTEEITAENAAKISELEEKAANAQEKADKLSNENEELNSAMRRLLVEKKQADKKIEELAGQTADIGLITKIEQKLNEAQAEREVIDETIKEKASRLEYLETQLKIKQSELEKLSEAYQSRQIKVSNAEAFLYREAPKCKNCHTPLKFKPSKKGDGYVWACPKWRKDGTGCPGTYYEANERGLMIIDRYKELLGDADKEIYYALPKKKLSKYMNSDIAFVPYPDSLNRLDPPTFLFQSLAVPEEVFKNRKNNKCDRYSKFQVSSNLFVHDISDLDQTIYSLALRLMNRGIVLRQYSDTDKELRDRFDDGKGLGKISSLFSYAKYKEPCYPYETKSAREKAFAEYYFPKILGDDWATYVFSQASFDLLVPEVPERFVGQRVDFFINRNGKKIVVEIDGPDHIGKSANDVDRDRFLESNEFIVRRYKNNDVDSKSNGILEDLTRTIGEINDERVDADLSDRFLAASKICHQFCVAIVKCLEKGCITQNINLKAKISSEMFTDSEAQFILEVAVSEVHAILSNYAEIYGTEFSINLCDKSEPELWICVGDGILNNCNSIMIRDCTIPINILCEIEDFKHDVAPTSTPSERALLFFQKYVFGYSSFRPKQYEAICRVVEKKDSIVLLPTGSGKSLVYQLSSYIVPGIIIVITPLISLIEDQVQNLEINNGITSSIYFSSAVTKEDKENKRKSRRLMQHNATTLIYMSPERLAIPSFREDSRGLLIHNNVFAVAIDEAHCVSEWGHDFRPAYLNVGNSSRRIFKRNGKLPAIIALTGTASDAVLNDVRLSLDIYGNDKLIQPDSFKREELHFSIKTCEAKAKDCNISALLRKDLPEKFHVSPEVFSKLSGKETYSGIVFTPLAKKKGSQYSALTLKGILDTKLPEFAVEDYFSGTPEDYEKETWKVTIRENARKFKNDEINLLVATKAFGMGIDKPNIRYIIHAGLPASFEEYYQEAGRAGRDRQHAECVLLFSNDNAVENEKLLNPDMDFNKLQEEYAAYNKEIYNSESADDVSSLLFFHNEAFAGIEDEVSVVEDILSRIESQGFEENKTIKIAVPLQIAFGDDNSIEVNKYNGDLVKKWLQTMVRLLILGVVEDYTYDYRQYFQVTCGRMEKESIAEKFGKYVAGNTQDRNYIDNRIRQIEEIQETGIALAKEASRVLIEYIYDNIEKSRRRAIYEMFDAVKQASEKVGEEQNDYLQKRIVSYFTYKGENRDILSSIETGEYAGLMEAITTYNIEPGDTEYSDGIREQARNTYILAGRILESKPDHPGLLVAQAIGRLLSDDYREQAVYSNVAAAIKYAKELYSIDNEIIKQSISYVMNLALKKSPDLFEDILSILSENINESTSDILSEMIQSDQIGDDNREYLLLSYANNRIQQTNVRKM